MFEKFKEIKSKENSLIKLVSSLQSSSKERHKNGLFVLEGLRICEDAYENGIRFDKLIISESAILKYKDIIIKFSLNTDDCFRIPDELFKKICDTLSPQGIITLCKLPDNSSNKINSDGRYIVLDNISDPTNLGAISRTAEALGVDGLILSDGVCDPYSPKSLRSSMGTLLRVPVIEVEDFKLLKTVGLTLYSCVVENNAKSITDIHFKNGCAIIIGNEANGVSDSTKELSDYLITIPMKGNAESFNAAAAAAIAAWEMMK